MINILFVDDEPNILTGLQRLLRPMRHDWDMSFANSGAEALELLAQRKIDVLVSDMKMPEMDGAQLLQQVQQRYPRLVRIVLSGYAENDLLLRTISVAHQYLAKPCDPDLLKTTISRVCALRDLVDNEVLRQLVTQLKVVPSLPTLYQQLMAELQVPEPSLKTVGDLIEQDLGLTAKLLQIVNSPLFGVRRTVTSAREAVLLLGLETISALALGVGVFAQLQPAARPALVEQLWAQSLQVAERAQWLAVSEAPDCAAAAFTAGLLHALGRIVIAVNLPQEYAAVEVLQAQEHLALTVAETRIYGTTSAAVGAYLLGLWGLPAPVVEAVSCQDDPRHHPASSFTALTALYLAKGLVTHAEDNLLTAPEKHFDQEYLQRVQQWEKLPAWYAACQAHTAHVG